MKFIVAQRFGPFLRLNGIARLGAHVTLLYRLKNSLAV
jgi:hypothetical protein